MLFQLAKNRKTYSQYTILKGKSTINCQKDSAYEDITISPRNSAIGVVNSCDCPHLSLEHVITADEEQKIRNALQNHFLFKDINEELLHILLYELFYFIKPLHLIA